MKITLSGICALLLLAGSAHAQMYKWVGPDGKITYSDTPPPKTAAKVEKKEMGGASVDTSNMPFALAETVKNFPVTLYTGSDCTPCSTARNHLQKRGIPFKEKTVSTNDDIDKLKELSGNQQLPVMTVGRNKQVGYEENMWNAALTAAGYPASNTLPKNYSNPKAEPAAPPAPKPVANNDNASGSGRTATTPPPPSGNAPPGFRF